MLLSHSCISHPPVFADPPIVQLVQLVQCSTPALHWQYSAEVCAAKTVQYRALHCTALHYWRVCFFVPLRLPFFLPAPLEAPKSSFPPPTLGLASQGRKDRKTITLAHFSLPPGTLAIQTPFSSPPPISFPFQQTFNLFQPHAS